jgi:paraquat-inducible protein A
VTEFVGRWSMIDVFVVGILVALIQVGNIMTIRPGVAAIAFAGMVVTTMLASLSFDPRLLWAPVNRDDRK